MRLSCAAAGGAGFLHAAATAGWSGRNYLSPQAQQPSEMLKYSGRLVFGPLEELDLRLYIEYLHSLDHPAAIPQPCLDKTQQLACQSAFEEGLFKIVVGGAYSMRWKRTGIADDGLSGKFFCSFAPEAFKAAVLTKISEEILNTDLSLAWRFDDCTVSALVKYRSTTGRSLWNADSLSFTLGFRRNTGGCSLAAKGEYGLSFDGGSAPAGFSAGFGCTD